MYDHVTELYTSGMANPLCMLCLLAVVMNSHFLRKKLLKKHTRKIKTFFFFFDNIRNLSKEKPFGLASSQ